MGKVTARYLTPSGGPAEGWLELQAAEHSIVVPLDANGDIAAELEVGVPIVVTEHFNGATDLAPFSIVVPDDGTYELYALKV